MKLNREIRKAFSAEISSACFNAKMKEITVQIDVIASTGIEIKLIKPRIFNTPGEYARPRVRAS